MSPLQLRAGTARQLADYVMHQLDHLFPHAPNGAELLQAHVPGALQRIKPILSACKAFRQDAFDHFNSMQYATFVYLLANELWQHGAGQEQFALCERLFLLNKALAGLDLYYKIAMPEVFFLSHGSGSVLANTEYGNKLVLFHNVTVGRYGESRPTIGQHVILFPGVIVAGNSMIGNGAVISAGLSIINQAVPDDCVVFAGPAGLVFKPKKKSYAAEFFR